MSLSNDQLSHELAAVHAELHAIVADLEEEMHARDAAAEHASAAADQHGISARFDSGAMLTSLRMPSRAPLTFAATELATILTTVLQNAHDASRAAAASYSGYDDDSALSPRPRQQATYVEASRDGDITIALDETGRVLWCTLTATAERWHADSLAERLLLLHNAAAMRAHSITPKFGTDATAAIKESFYTDERIAQFRLEKLTF